MKKLTALLAGLIIALGVSTTTFAATDGTLGGQSTATMAMTLSVAQQMKISGFQDIVLDSTQYDGSTDYSAPVQNLCIYTNAADGAYEFYAATNERKFELSNGVSYAVNFSSNQSGPLSAVPHGEAVTGTDGAKTIDCQGPNDKLARMQVTFLQNNGVLPEGTGSQTLVVFVFPVS